MSTKRIHIHPSWSFHDDNGNHLDPQLFQLLHALFSHEKLTHAAKATGISYRHAWNLINKWSDFFGTELVILERGKGAQLTPLGQKLVWAEQRVMARFQPQMASMASEINVELNKALANAAPVLKIQASHGYAVELLPSALSSHDQSADLKDSLVSEDNLTPENNKVQAESLQLDLQYNTALQALAAMNRDECDIAGFHLPSDVLVPSLVEDYRRLLKPRAHKVIRFIRREQGLIVAKNNPLNINDLQDLAVINEEDGIRPRFINRQQDCGTRALFDQLLINHNIDATSINGYHNHEFTHSAVAAFVAAGMADVGFGVKEAAHKFELDFIPLCQEDYLLVCHQRKLKQAAVESFIQAISAEYFRHSVDQLAGYNADHSGEIIDLALVLTS